MKNVNNFENDLIYKGAYNNICEENYKLLINKYIKLYGEEKFEKIKKDIKNNLLSHYKILNNNKSVSKMKKFKTVEEIENAEDYTIILPYIKKQLLLHFKDRGIEIQNINQFIKLCAE